MYQNAEDKIIILPVVLHRCEKLPLTLREEQTFQESEKNVLKTSLDLRTVK
jgi:hypothetical protein